MDELTHLDKKGKVKMVDIGKKEVTFRKAKATCTVKMSKLTLALIKDSKVEKGDVFTTAKIAGIMAAKKTADLIPMCHPLNILSVDINFETKNDAEIIITSVVKLKGMTGAEMEALNSCALAALTIYDMVKSKEKGILITDLRLLEKEGGKSGKWKAKEDG
ncbi:MAG: cyclic pyranopterin monophosphate synthase MoaC [Actinobacteria bacterium]|nr:MAG: cyclic pyranopterin monophosphate synthase MoaC [Actinomycetota bacterium]